jgi:hypothetical protein
MQGAIALPDHPGGARRAAVWGEAIAAAAPQLHSYALGSYGLKVMEVIKGQAGLYMSI